MPPRVSRQCINLRISEYLMLFSANVWSVPIALRQRDPARQAVPNSLRRYAEWRRSLWQ